MYRVFVSTNFKDSWRDPDDINIEELGYFNKSKDAINEAKKYISKFFFKKSSKLKKAKYGWFCFDSVSYAPSIYIHKINVK